MQYISWADITINIGLVTGLSYTRRAHTREHSGGYVDAQGMDAAEISVRVYVGRAQCMALGLDYWRERRAILGLAAAKDGPSGPVTVGGYPIYPELNFAITNINITFSADLADDGTGEIEADITLAGVSCVKEVCRDRALVFSLYDTQISLPAATIECNGKSLTLQDSLSISRYDTAPDRMEMEILIGQDDQSPERRDFLLMLIDNAATVTCKLPQGTVTYHCALCEMVDNVLQISGVLFPDSAQRAHVHTFTDCDISDIIAYICNFMGIEYTILISGHVDYFLMDGTPIDTLEALQAAAGFVVSRQGNVTTFAYLPEKIEPQVVFNLTITDDSTQGPTTGVKWTDGVNYCEAGDKDGEVISVVAPFRSSEGAKFADQVLKRRRYNQSYIRVEDVLDDRIGSHSQIAVMRGLDAVPVLVDYPIFNWIDGTMILECREIL